MKKISIILFLAMLFVEFIAFLAFLLPISGLFYYPFFDQSLYGNVLGY